MLLITYNKTTKKLTGWNGDERQFSDCKSKDSDQIAILDVPVPIKSIRALNFDEATLTLIDNPDYIEPVTRDLAAEVDELKTKLDILTK